MVSKDCLLSTSCANCFPARVDPIPFNLKQDLTGVGKISQDVRMIETTVSQRRELTSERMRKETLEERESREVRHHLSLHPPRY